MSDIRTKTGAYTLINIDENGEKTEESKTFNFYIDLRMSKKIEFVNSVVSNIVGESYYPILKDIMFDIMLIHYFTDVDVDEVLDSNNAIDDIEDFLERTNIVDIVKKNIGNELLDSLITNINHDIEYKTGIRHSDISLALKSLINTFENKVKDVDTENMMDLATKLSGVTESLTVDNIIEAYAKTDVFKENRDSIIEEKNKKITEITDLLKKKNNSVLDSQE